MDKTIRNKLNKEERLNKKEIEYLFKDKPEIIVLFDEADFIINLAKMIL